MTLLELAEKYKTDKLTEHSYIPVYQALFDSLTIPVRTVLEIGIGYFEVMGYPAGASLKMWRDYFPDATVYGLDIDSRAMVKEDRIQTFLGSQSSEDDLAMLMRAIAHPLDLVIDDGSHLFEDQIKTAKFLLPYLSKGGAYVIEDIACIHDLQKAMGEGEIFQGTKRFDDNILLIRR